MRRVVINKRHWAVGLQWFTINAKQSEPDLRREAGKLDHALDMVAYRQRQYGFAVSGGPVRDWLGVRALAAAVRITSPSFLGLFCLADQGGEFWWVFATSQSLIVGMGDQVFPTRIEAQEWIESLKGLLDSGFAETVSCETVDESLHWLTPLVSAGPFSRFRGRNGYLQPLQPLPGQRRKLAAMCGVAAVLLLGGYGFKKFLDHQAGKRAMEAARVAMVNKEQHKQELLAHPERYFQQPWITAPAVDELVSRGVAALLRLPMAASGWVLERAVFDGLGVVVTWGHRPGADYVHLPLSARIESPHKAISRLPVSGHRVMRPVESLLPREECTRLLYQGTQLMGAHLRLTYNNPEKKRVDNVEISAPWMRGQWEVSEIPSAMLEDAALPKVFSCIPGIMLESIAFEKNVWVIKGAVYVAAK